MNWAFANTELLAEARNALRLSWSNLNPKQTIQSLAPDNTQLIAVKPRNTLIKPNLSQWKRDTANQLLVKGVLSPEQSADFFMLDNIDAFKIARDNGLNDKIPKSVGLLRKFSPHNSTEPPYWQPYEHIVEQLDPRENKFIHHFPEIHYPLDSIISPSPFRDSSPRSGDVLLAELERKRLVPQEELNQLKNKLKESPATYLPQVKKLAQTHEIPLEKPATIKQPVYNPDTYPLLTDEELQHAYKSARRFGYQPPAS